MKSKVPSFLLKGPSPATFNRGRGRLKMPFIEKGIHHLANVIKSGYIQWEYSSRTNLFQKIDARVKVLFLLFFVIIVNLKRDIESEVLIGAFVFVLALRSRLNIFSFYKGILFFGFIFGFLIALPSGLNLITKGKIIFPMLHLSKPYSLWIYHIPEEIGFTREGMFGVMMLFLRVINSLAISFLVLYTTPFPEIIKALKVLKVPESFLMIVTLSYKYIFIFAKTIEDMHLAKKSRLAGQVKNADARRWIAGRIAFIFRKTRIRCEDVFAAMLSRGLSDKIKFYGHTKFRMLDWSAGLSFLLIGILFLMI